MSKLKPIDPSDPPLWVSVARACYLTSFGKVQMHEMIKEGVVISRKVGGKRLVLYRSLEHIGEGDACNP